MSEGVREEVSEGGRERGRERGREGRTREGRMWEQGGRKEVSE